MRSERGSPFVQALAYHALGRAHLAAGEPRAALEALEQGQALPLPGDFTPLHAAYMAERELGLGDGEAARATVERAIRSAETACTRAWKPAHISRERGSCAPSTARRHAMPFGMPRRAETLVARRRVPTPRPRS